MSGVLESSLHCLHRMLSVFQVPGPSTRLSHRLTAAHRQIRQVPEVFVRLQKRIRVDPVHRVRSHFFNDPKSADNQRQITRCGVSRIRQTLLVQVLDQILPLVCRQAWVVDRPVPVSLCIGVQARQAVADARAARVVRANVVFKWCLLFGGAGRLCICLRDSLPPPAHGESSVEHRSVMI